MNKEKIPILSLFCGCGAFDLGFTQQEYEIVLALDKNASAVKSYNHNHPERVARVADLSCLDGRAIERMIKTLQPDTSIRGVIGGAPCQSFSNGNVHKRKDDIRNTLPRRFAEILTHLNRSDCLDFFVFENVQGISSSKHVATFRRFKRYFEQAGFNLFEGMLDAQHFGVPQMRPRVFVVGLNRAKFPNLTFGFPIGKPDCIKTVGSVLRSLQDPMFFKRGLSSADIPVHPNHWTMVPKSEKFRNGMLKEGEVKGRSFRVLAWNKPSWTVAYGNREIHVHPSGRRRLSVYEAMLLQGLPSSYELKGTLSDQVRQVSDLVPSQVGNALAESIRCVITNIRNKPSLAKVANGCPMDE